jgi:Flp pilus assembly protein TadD
MSDRQTSGLALARHYLDVDRPQAALDALANVQGDELEDGEYWSIRAEALLHLGRAKEGAEAARRGLEQEPYDIGLLDALALCELDNRNFAAAERALASALEVWPEHPTLLSHRALVLAVDRRYDAAREVVAEAMRVDPESPAVLRIRAQVAVLSNDWNAERYVDELLAAAPEDQIAHALRGNLAAKRKNYKHASAAFTEAARLDPSDAEIADVARDARVAAHPVLAPVRPLWRFGRWRSYFLYLGIISVLAVARLETLRVIVICVWLVIVVLSWFGPRILRRREQRRYGGF